MSDRSLGLGMIAGTVATVALAFGCSSSPDAPAQVSTVSPASDGGDAPDVAPADTAVAPGTDSASATCSATTAAVPVMPALHVAIGTAIDWNSNPPSSGQHFPIWAAFQEYSTPVPRGYYVHDLEHGAVVFLYNCGSAPCPDVVAALRAAADALPTDPLCTAAGEGIRVRTVITPDPLLDVRVAAVAWGFTYKADCADVAELSQFASEHYGQGPEVLCENGTTDF